MHTTLTARRLITDTEEIDYPMLRIEDGKIVALEAGTPNGSAGTLTSAFFDIHVHGARSYDFMAANQSQITEVGAFLATRGVGHYCPTTVTGPLDPTLQALERLANAIESEAADGASPTATPVGIHLEGPFISHGKRGVHPDACILEPDLLLFQRFQEAARGHIRLVTVAPELPHALEFIEHLYSTNVRVAMGHSKATASETTAAIAAGATNATHLFNAMAAIDHREPGIAGTILDCDDVYAELICDGVHVHPAIVRLWLKLKGAEKGILVTDGTSATGMPDGTYMLGDLTVEVKEGVCMLGETLAGSVLTMDQAVANVRRFTRTSLATAVRLASRNPARMMGMPQLTSVAPGSFASFNLYDEDGKLKQTILRGNTILT